MTDPLLPRYPDLMGINESLDEIQERAIASLSAWKGADEEDRTKYVKEIAAAYVDARAKIYAADGSPDWLGRSKPYRDWVREAMAFAGIPQSVRVTLQNAIRFHSGNILRERLTPELLTELGLEAEGPRERMAHRRKANSDKLAALVGDKLLEGKPEILDALSTVESTIRRISRPAIREMSDADQREVSRAVDRLAGFVGDIALTAPAGVPKAVAAPQRNADEAARPVRAKRDAK